MTVDFPPLPDFASSSNYKETDWSPNVYEAYEKLRARYKSASSILIQEADPLRLQVQLEILIEELPLVEALEDSAENEHLPYEWILKVAEVYANLIKTITEAQSSAKDRDETNIYYENLVSLRHTGKQGRPRKEINARFMKQIVLPKYNFRFTAVTSSLKLCRNTLKARMREANISYKHSSISDAELDAIVRTYRQTKIGSGIRYLTGHLRNVLQLKIPRYRVYRAVKRVDKVGSILRGRKGIRRRPYSVKRPNALWHVDGHHKLILWGIVIHGIVDGFDRFITAMRASNNNRASTVLHLLQDAEKKHGEPSRMRGDRGKENKGIALSMIARRGLNRGSFIWGPSTHNTRIERLWVEAGTQFVRRWRAFFFRLEALHGLDRSNPHHLWLLHELFLATINDDCQEFVLEWNAHPISGEGHDRSPEEMRLLGKLNQGIYIPDECEGLCPEEIEKRYGLLGSPLVNPVNHTGAGYLSDEEIDDLPNLDEDGDSDHAEPDSWEDMPTGYDNQFIEAVNTPPHRNPFKNRPDLERVFREALARANDEGIIPSGYGILPEEWEMNVYLPYEVLRTGKRAGKELRVELPDAIWRPRAQLWARALDVCLHLEAALTG